jgi:excisionase family DNA binding protein
VSSDKSGQPLHTVRDVAKLLQVDDEHVLELIHSGKLTASNVGAGSRRPRWRISQQSLDAFLSSRQPKFRPAPRRKPMRNEDVIEFYK